MLTTVKNQIKISLLSIKYALTKEMLNKVSFITNIVFMILNNASFLIEWFVLFSIKDSYGGYGLKQVMLLWGFAAATYGVSRFFFKKAFNLSETITNGKLDSFLVQPKNVLLSCITTDVEPSAIGDMIYGYIILILYGATLKQYLLFFLLSILGGLIVTSVAVILGSLSFWFSKADMVADTGNSMMTNFATYPEGIFKNTVRLFFYTIIPIGFANYIPTSIIIHFNVYYLLMIVLMTIFFISLAFIVFNTGLKRYSSSNLMIAKI